MEQWIQRTLSAGQFDVAVFPAVFLLGMLGAVTSCCALPAIGAVAGYAGTLETRNNRRDLLLIGLFFMIGTIISLALLGALTGFVGHAIGSSLGKYWRLAAGLLMVLFGLVTLGVAPRWIRGMNISTRPNHRSIFGVIGYGLAVGGAATACSVGCNPLLMVVVGTAALKGATMTGAILFAVFALGYSLPLAAGLVGIGLSLDKLKTVAQRFVTAIRVGGGVLLVGVGFYLLATI